MHVTDPNTSCENESDTIVITEQSVEKSLQIFPTYAQNKITVQYSYEGTTLTKDPGILIYNSMGNKVYEKILVG